MQRVTEKMFNLQKSVKSKFLNVIQTVAFEQISCLFLQKTSMSSSPEEERLSLLKDTHTQTHLFTSSLHLFHIYHFNKVIKNVFITSHQFFQYFFSFINLKSTRLHRNDYFLFIFH